MKASIGKHFIFLGIAFVNIIFFLTYASPVYSHSEGVVLSGWGTAVIDGQISQDEWDENAFVEFSVNTPEGGLADGIFYSMNDEDNLYLAIIFNHTALSNSASIQFDNNHDGSWVSPGDDEILINPNPDVGFWDLYKYTGFPCPDNSICGERDTENGGSNDGSGAFFSSESENVTIYEYSHPLNSSDDAHDFSLNIGDTVGFRLLIRMIKPPGEWPVDFGDTTFPSFYGDIILIDNCPDVTNPDQSDSDNDGFGDACDGCPDDPKKTEPGICSCEASEIDSDNDGTPDCNDGCPEDSNKTEPGLCGCGLTDDDGDSDGIPDCSDNCQVDQNANQADSDNDDIGDICDTCPKDTNNDADRDGVCGNIDNCPTSFNSDQTDADGDGAGDACDMCPNSETGDSDADGVCDDSDQCPDFNDSVDTDSDSIVDGCDDCPADSNNDQDSDGVCGDTDNCPSTNNPTQADADSDDFGDVCDTCPNDADNDADNDGVCGDLDECPNDINKTEPGVCGCGEEDTDLDLDGTLDCEDGCPDDPNKIEPDTTGCGYSDDYIFPGANQETSPAENISLLFDEVTSGGVCNAMQTDKPSPPNKRRFFSQTYDISCTVDFNGIVTVCFDYADSKIKGKEKNIMLMHHKDDGPWEDITTVIDTKNDTICGQTTSFSEFAVGEFDISFAYGAGGGGIFGDILKANVIGYHLDGFTTKGVQVYMPVTPGFRALKGAQEYVRSFAPNFAVFVRECFDLLEQKADSNKEGILYKIGTYVFPVLGKIAEGSLRLIGEEEYIEQAYNNTTISVEEFEKLEKKGLAIAPKTVKNIERSKQEQSSTDLVLVY